MRSLQVYAIVTTSLLIICHINLTAEGTERARTNLSRFYAIITTPLCHSNLNHDR